MKENSYPDSTSSYRVADAWVDRYTNEAVTQGLAWIGDALGWSSRTAGPLGRIIKHGARVVVKPNWVMHQNKGPWGMECLVTHPTVVRAVVDAVLQTRASEVVLGDAPLQGCDFQALMKYGGMSDWAAVIGQQDRRFRGPLDFRRTKSRVDGTALIREEQQLPLSDFVLVDLGGESLLEPVSNGQNRFRVTRYDPRLMASTHRPGIHQYLIARALLEADVVVNLPKLKTHRKAGMTNALKNLVGINGNKEYLPHHRVGGAAAGGDCYPGKSALKRMHERLLDMQNTLRSPWLQRIVGLPARGASLASRFLIDHLGVEGAWSGNDTVWRMCLDLNRILVYGRPDGSMASEPQRLVISIADAITAGQGDGPLAPEPLALHSLLGGGNAAAVDLVGTELLGYEPKRIPLVHHAFEVFRWPIAPLGLSSVVTCRERRTVDAEHPGKYPVGWLDAVDPAPRASPPVGRAFWPALDRVTTSAE